MLFSLGLLVVKKTVTNSSCEAEYVALSEASREALWLRQFLREVQFLKPHPTVLLCDNNGAKSLSSDPTHHSHSKHINIHHHFVRERIEYGSITVWRFPGHDNITDIFMKASLVPTLHAFILTLASGDACVRRSLWLAS